MKYLQGRNMFRKFIIDLKDDTKSRIRNIKCSPVTVGRYGTNAGILKDGKFPVVRTTTAYHEPYYICNDDLKGIIDTLKVLTGCDFNNIMIEHYTKEYRTMKFHSDQMTDLDEDSVIAILTLGDSRTFIYKDKQTEVSKEIEMSDCSVITFDIMTNKKYLHKIQSHRRNESDSCTILTFRKSKTYCLPYALKLATPEERRMMYKMKSDENLTGETQKVDYTISPADLMPPVEIL